jgi:xanthine/uracil/vitamin C permease (AzgA family)
MSVLPLSTDEKNVPVISTDRSLSSILQKIFHLSERRSDIPTEIRAGVSTFLTMSYILLVNPQLISKIGIPATDVVISTALASAISSFIVGFVGYDWLTYCLLLLLLLLLGLIVVTCLSDWLLESGYPRI